MLTPWEVEQIRKEHDRTLPDEVTILRRTLEHDGGGGRRETWAEVATVPARVGTPLGGESDLRANTSARLSDEDLHTVWLKAKTDIREEDRVVWQGRNFEVYVVIQRGNWELYRRVRIKEL